MSRKQAFRNLHTIKRALADGTVATYYYHRRTKKRIEGAFGSPEFHQSYVDASKIDRIPTHSTLGSLVQRYRASRGYSKLAERTRRDYEGLLAHITDIWSDMPLSVLDDRSVRAGIIEERDRFAERSERRADYFVSVLSAVIRFGIDTGLLEHNRARGIPSLYKADRADKIWLPEHVAKFDAVASNELRLAMVLALHTGQRQGDLLRLTWTTFDGKAITLRQEKTKAWVYVPCTDALRTALAETPRRATTILTNSHGLTWSPDGFRASWRKACERPIPEISFEQYFGELCARAQSLLTHLNRSAHKLLTCHIWRMEHPSAEPISPQELREAFLKIVEQPAEIRLEKKMTYGKARETMKKWGLTDDK